MNASVPTDHLRTIATLARANRLDEASVQAATTFKQYPNDPILAALAGAIECHRRQFERAITYLKLAHRHHPADLTVRTNLVEALAQVGRTAEALQLCDAAVVFADPSLRLARLGGHIAQSAEAYEQAIAFYRHILARDGRDWSTWNNLGNALSGAGDPVAAAEALQKAADLAPDSAPIRLNLGGALIEAERFAEAEAVFQKAVADFPQDAKPLVTLADYYRRSGRDDEAFEALGRAAQRAPDDAEILADYGQDAARRTEYAVAEKSYEAALLRNPSLGPAIVGLAALYERTNREDELVPLRARAVTAKVDNQSIAYIDALQLKREERFDEALRALEQSGDVVVPHRKHQLRGILLDRLGQHDEAFVAFAAMNVERADEPARPLELARLYREQIVHDQTLMSPEWLSSWTPPIPSGPRRAPVFLVGFPRSGTTLLDTMLMAAPDTLILEEEPFIGNAEVMLGGVEGLATASAEQLIAAREQYFEQVDSLGVLGPETVVIDKHPLHLNKVPTICRLFPGAQFILALRHPCDVLLSCFITNFRTNPGMSNFLTLDSAAELYDLSLASWTKARELFDLPVHTVVYERLVADKDRELQPLFAALGLPWPGANFDHRIAARERGVVSTASYAQVTEPIYTRSSGRWRQYEQHLAPVIAQVRPWIERFGYAVEDDRVPLWPSCVRSSEGVV